MGKNAPQFGNFERLGYGAGELGPAMAGSTIIFFQLVFLTDVAGMNPGLARRCPAHRSNLGRGERSAHRTWLGPHPDSLGAQIAWMVVSAFAVFPACS